MHISEVKSACPPTLGKHLPCFPQLPVRALQLCEAPILSLPYVSISTIPGHPTCLKIYNSQTNERRALKIGRYIIWGKPPFFQSKKLSYIFFLICFNGGFKKPLYIFFSFAHFFLSHHVEKKK